MTSSSQSSISSSPPFTDRQPSTLHCKTPVAFPANRTKKLTRAVGEYVRSTFCQPSWRPTLSRELLDKFNVQIWKLDLDDPYTPWARPVPLEQITEWLKEKKPWQVRGHGCGWIDMEPGNCAWWNAKFLTDDLCGYVQYGETTREPGMMYEHTGWSFCGDLPYMGSVDSGMRYLLADVLTHSDTSLPHITGVLAQDFKLNDELTVIELFALANLTDIRIVDGVNPKDARIPVTLISIGDCNIRVLHGCFDGLCKAIYLQVSRIMSFYEPDGFETDDWKRALAWLLATPTYEEPTDEEPADKE